MNKYPGIYKALDGTIYYYLNKSNFFSPERDRWKEDCDNNDHKTDVNITAEYLANTYGEVRSKEHAEFIVKLAEVNGFKLKGYARNSGYFYTWRLDDGSLFFSFCKDEKVAMDDDEKLITIPLPPKDKSMESQKEWPQVGDKALTDSKEVVEVVAIDNDVAWLKHSFCETKYGYLSMRIKMLSKPPTPEEELTKELEKMVYDGMDNSYDLNHNCYYLVSGLMKKYDIKKKPE